MHKTIGDTRDPWRLAIRVQKVLFCMQKPQMRTGPIGTSNSDARHSVLHAQNHR